MLNLRPVDAAEEDRDVKRGRPSGKFAGPGPGSKPKREFSGAKPQGAPPRKNTKPRVDKA